MDNISAGILTGGLARDAPRPIGQKKCRRMTITHTATGQKSMACKFEIPAANRCDLRFRGKGDAGPRLLVSVAVSLLHTARS